MRVLFDDHCHRLVNRITTAGVSQTRVVALMFVSIKSITYTARVLLESEDIVAHTKLAAFTEV